MGRIAIQANKLGKRYRIGVRQKKTANLPETLRDIAGSPFRYLNTTLRAPSASEILWALKDVSFEIRPGEIVGIIGRNGAGKSTLLKILSRITEPTIGRAKVYARVGSLLEVGTGFHPELTGRENIYLNGAILGMRRAEIRRKFDEIVAFSEVEQFIDTPVKRYSSGMYVRLAFAVAAHLEPKILLVDEVLAVGDASFQKRCLGKMDDVVRQEGRTVLFVSHNMTAIQGICDRVIWFDGGQIVEDGLADKVIPNYLNSSSSSLTQQLWDDLTLAPGNEQARIHRVCVRPEYGLGGNEISVRSPLVVEIEYWNLIPDAFLNVSLVLYNEQGVAVLATAPMFEPEWHKKPFPIGHFLSTCHIPGDLLNDGRYRIELYIVKDQGTVIYRQSDILVFDVIDAVDARGNWYGEWLGVVRPNLNWRTKLIKTTLQ